MGLMIFEIFILSIITLKLRDMKTKLIGIVLFNLVFVVSLLAQKDLSNNNDNRSIEKGQLLKNTHRINYSQLNENSITSVIYKESFENNNSDWNTIGEWKKGVPKNKLISGRKLSTCIGTNLEESHNFCEKVKEERRRMRKEEWVLLDRLWNYDVDYIGRTWYYLKDLIEGIIMLADHIKNFAEYVQFLSTKYLIY